MFRYDPRVILVAFTPEEAEALAIVAEGEAERYHYADDHVVTRTGRYIGALHDLHIAKGRQFGRAFDALVEPYRPAMMQASGVVPGRWLSDELDRLEAALAELAS